MKLAIGIAAATLLTVSASAPAGAHGAHHDASPIYELPSMTPVQGASAHLTRSGGGATINFDSSGFGPHHAVTVWVFSFDHPENCDFGGQTPDGRYRLCGFGDDGAPDTGFSVQQLAGHVIGANGNANFGGHVDVDNPMGAEFHVVSADHGAMDPAQLPGQIMSPAMGSQIAFFIP